MGMHDFNLKMVKVLLVALTVSIVFGMVSGISLLRNSYYWRTPFFVMQADFVKETLLFASYEHGGIFAWLASLRKPQPAPVADNETAKSIPILLYHGVIDDPKWQPDDVNMSLKDFRAQLFALRHAGWRTISLPDYLAFMAGKKTLPAKSFILTFDDGRKDSYYPVDPILRVLGYAAVMNVITGRSLAPESEKSNFHLSQIELKKMAESGRWEMASHTKDDHGYVPIAPSDRSETAHALTDRQWIAREGRLETDLEYAARVERDLKESKADIEKRLLVRPIAFAYPFGDFGQESLNHPESTALLAGILRPLFPITFYQTRGSEFINNYAGDPFMSRRIDMKSEKGVSVAASAANLLRLFDNNREKALDYADDLTADRGWLRGWGTLSVGGGTMALGDSPTDDSSMAFLGGSYLWKDYYLKAQVSTKNAAAFSLLARYGNEGNHVACDFTADHVAFAEQVSGHDRLDTERLQKTGIDTGRMIEAGIAVYGSWVGCYLDGKLVVSGSIGGDLANGGIGFKMWDTDQKGGAIVLNRLEVVSADPRLR